VNVYCIYRVKSYMHIMDCLTGKDCIVSCARVSTQCTEALRLMLYVLHKLLTTTLYETLLTVFLLT